MGEVYIYDYLENLKMIQKMSCGQKGICQVHFDYAFEKFIVADMEGGVSYSISHLKNY